MGRVKEELISESGQEEYPDGLVFTDYRDYHPALHAAERIYIQNPYDGENPCLTVPPAFYAQRLRQTTKELILIPPLPTTEIRKEEERDRYVMTPVVLSPGVFYADRIYVPTESMKDLFVEKLIAFAGEKLKERWREEIIVWPGKTKEPEAHSPKKLLFCIGAEIPLSCKVQTKFEILEDAGRTIDVSVCLFPSEESLGERIITIREWTKKLRMPVFAYNKEQEEELAEDFDAYYGSPSPLVQLFTLRKKPVMIASYE